MKLHTQLVINESTTFMYMHVHERGTIKTHNMHIFWQRYHTCVINNESCKTSCVADIDILIIAIRILTQQQVLCVHYQTRKCIGIHGRLRSNILPCIIQTLCCGYSCVLFIQDFNPVPCMITSICTYAYAWLQSNTVPSSISIYSRVLVCRSMGKITVTVHNWTEV